MMNNFRPNKTSNLPLGKVYSDFVMQIHQLGKYHRTESKLSVQDNVVGV